MLDFEKNYLNKSVAVTGHTGFTGGWLTSWLNSIGANISGLSLPPNTTPNLHQSLNLDNILNSHIGDISDPETVNSFFDLTRPEIVFHLAAQPLVSLSYDDPFGTFNSNVMGTLNVLEAARNCEQTKAVVCITTDKVYRNNEWSWAYREVDVLGGKDPYSASKSACEMVIHSYQSSLAARGNGVQIASARGGNIIGGGDWAADRIVPDFVRAATSNGSLTLRNPSATRPWQHVLALCHGYLVLADKLLSKNHNAASAWNFGPSQDGERSVGDLVSSLEAIWPKVDIEYGAGTFGESHFLSVSSEKARKHLNWVPGLNFMETVEWTVRWYQSYYETNTSAKNVTIKQIEEYRRKLSAQKQSV